MRGVELPESVPDENQRPKWPSNGVRQHIFVFDSDFTDFVRYHNFQKSYFSHGLYLFLLEFGDQQIIIKEVLFGVS